MMAPRALCETGNQHGWHPPPLQHTPVPAILIHEQIFGEQGQVDIGSMNRLGFRGGQLVKSCCLLDLTLVLPVEVAFSHNKQMQLRTTTAAR